MSMRKLELAQSSIRNYFDTHAISDYIISSLVENNSLDSISTYDYTSVIGISGPNKGGLFVSCEKQFLVDLLYVMIGSDTSINDEILSDLVGEMANTLSGYFQSTYGETFMISIPHVIMGDADLSPVRLTIKEPSDCVYFTWKGHKALLCFSFEGDG